MFVKCNKKGCAKHFHHTNPTFPYGKAFPEESEPESSDCNSRGNSIDARETSSFVIKLGRSYEEQKPFGDFGAPYIVESRVTNLGATVVKT